MNEKNQHLPSLVNFPLNLATIFILWQQKMATKEANQPMITTWLYTFLLEYKAKLQNTRPLLSIVNLLLPWSRSRVFEYTSNKHSLPSSAAPAVPQSFSRHILHITIPYRHHEMYVRFYERNTQTCLAIM